MQILLIQNVLDNPHSNGITLFVLGVLFVLCIYHFLLYFQHRDKSYLLYSLYTFLLFLRNIKEPVDSFIYKLDVFQPFIKLAECFSPNLEWLYNTVYFAFAFTFVDIWSYSKKWYKFIFSGVAFLIGLNIFIAILNIMFNIPNIMAIAAKVFIVLFLIFSVIGYIILFKEIKGFVKYYIIVGSLIFLITSLISFMVSRLQIQSPGSQLNVSIFFIGMLIENMCFALGLGHKQKQILHEKNVTQQKLINQFKENEKLKAEIQLQLEQDVKDLSKQAETEKLEKIKANYEKELAELKVSSLRSQMNPHFIFNSLNSIKLYIIKNEKENAVYYLNKFSKLIRKILASTREKEMSLADEIETMELYINIENIRFKNEIVFNINIDNTLNLDTIKIPSLIMQPFIENAIWHGLSPKKGLKKLDISVKNEFSFVSITITDNGVGREKSALLNSKKIHKKSSVGISLTKERLRNFSKNYKNNYQIKFNDLYNTKQEATGTTVEIKLPLV